MDRRDLSVGGGVRVGRLPVFILMNLRMHVGRGAVALLVVFAASAVLAAEAKFELRSSAFVDNGKYPVDFTCDGSRAAPPVEWVNPPSGTKSFAITMHHVPGPGDMHVYWVVYNIPADVHSIAQNAKGNWLLGINTVNGRPEYAPPCSKGPGEKKYTLTVYALSSPPKIDSPANGVTMEVLLAAIKDRTLATSTLNVTYTRAGRAAANAEANGADPRHNERGNGNTPGGGGGERRPAPIDRAMENLQLTPEQRAKAEPLLRAYRDKMQSLRQERERLEQDLLGNLKNVLDPAQYEKLLGATKSAENQPPPPPPAR